MVLGGKRDRRKCGAGSNSEANSKRSGGDYRVSAEQNHLIGLWLIAYGLWSASVKDQPDQALEELLETVASCLSTFPSRERK